jgi:RHS repeat-associated protein
MTYDAVGNLLSITDSVSNTTSYIYDDRNRVISETNQLGFSRTMFYDDVSNQTSITDRNGRLRTFFYDALNRQTVEIWMDDNGLPIYSTTSSYDAEDQVIYITNPDSTYSYSYDEMGRVLTVDNAGTPDVANVVLTYNYDEKGNVISVADSIDGIASGVTTYEYDRINRTTSITQSGVGVADKRVDFDYNAVGQYDSINRYSDLTGTNLVIGSDYVYDQANRLTDLIHNNGISDIAFYNLTYDGGSRITQIIDIDGSNDFAYDSRDQLLNATHSDVNNDDENYSYDANGNRTLAGYVTGVNNELLSDGVYNYDYDNEGNLISQTDIATGEVRLFTWDYLNRLVMVTDLDTVGNEVQTVEFSYDMYGRRLSKLVDSVATYFVYDRDDVILDFVDDGSNVVLDMRYLHGNRVDEVLAQEDSNGNVTWLLTDYLGTIRDLVDNGGSVVNHLTYDSYGNVVSESDSAVDSRYRFTGREWDEEIDLYYYRARYYDGETGRFISVDPISFDSGTYNLYGYVDNNPISNIDPTGLETRIYIHVGGTWYGHAAIDVNGTVYTYGRYRSDNPPKFTGLKGDGILYQVPRHDYLTPGGNFRKDNESIDQWSIDFSPEEEKQITEFFEQLYKQGRTLTPPLDVIKLPSGAIISGRDIDDYFFLGNNCTTLTLDSLPKDNNISSFLRANILYAPAELQKALIFLQQFNPKVKRLSPLIPHKP